MAFDLELSLIKLSNAFLEDKYKDLKNTINDALCRYCRYKYSDINDIPLNALGNELDKNKDCMAKSKNSYIKKIIRILMQHKFK